MRPKKLEIGDKVKWIRKTRHVVAFLEDDGKQLVVYKIWYPGRGWRYDCEYLTLFLYNICLQENYTDAKRKQLFNLNGLVYGEW